MLAGSVKLLRTSDSFPGSALSFSSWNFSSNIFHLEGGLKAIVPRRFAFRLSISLKNFLMDVLNNNFSR